MNTARALASLRTLAAEGVLENTVQRGKEISLPFSKSQGRCKMKTQVYKTPVRVFIMMHTWSHRHVEECW